MPRLLAWAFAWSLAWALALPAATAFAQSQQLTLQATTEWQRTDARLLEGDLLSVEASGEWSNDNGKGYRLTGPDGFRDERDSLSVIPDAPFAALIGRIGEDGPPFLVGRRHRVRVSGSGALFLAMNDRPRTYDDNLGALNVVIRVVPRPIPMPDVVGMTGPEAKSLIQATYPAIAVITRRGSASTRPANTVVSQSPLKGEDMRLAGKRGVQLTLAPPPPPTQPLPPPVVTGGSDSSTEVDNRLAKVEEQIRQIDENIRSIRAEIKQTNRNHDRLQAKLDALSTRIDAMPDRNDSDWPRWLPPLVYLIGAVGLALIAAQAGWTWRLRTRLEWMERLHRLRMRTRLDRDPDPASPSNPPRLPEHDFHLEYRLEPGNAGTLGALPISDTPNADAPTGAR